MRIKFRDYETGMICEAAKSGLGTWCGYVTVEPGHPDYGRDYAEVELDHDPHGGLTFSGESDDGWVLGFDCAHWGDYVPAIPLGGGEYRDIDFIVSECAKLARDLEKKAKVVESVCR